MSDKIFGPKQLSDLADVASGGNPNDVLSLVGGIWTPGTTPGGIISYSSNYAPVPLNVSQITFEVGGLYVCVNWGYSRDNGPEAIASFLFPDPPAPPQYANLGPLVQNPVVITGWDASAGGVPGPGVNVSATGLTITVTGTGNYVHWVAIGELG